MDVGMMMIFSSYGWEEGSDGQMWEEELRLGEIAARWGQTIETFPASWQSFVHEGLGVSPLLVDRGLLDRLAASVNPTRLANNPRIFRTEEIRTLYESLSQ